jgi:hypothetical protein
LAPGATARRSPAAVRDDVATIRVSPIVETDAAFVKWRANFDCAAEDVDRWTSHFAHKGFAKWLAAPRRFIETVRR